MPELTLTVPVGVDDWEGWAQDAVAARERLLNYCQWVNPRYERPAHLEALGEELEAIEAGENDRLITMMPPRHGKSVTASQYFPAWYIARNPYNAVISASYGAELGHGFGRLARNVLANPRSQQIFPDVQLAPDSRAAHLWHTSQGGMMLSSGIPGPITGRGANHLNIDDPIKTIEEAMSAIYREKVWQWWLNDARTRLEPKGTVAITLTHWHDDDIVGRLLNSPGASRWRVLKFPAIALEDDPLGRLPGEALWPFRYDEAALAEIREDMGETQFAALFQQDPIPEGGSVFGEFRVYDVPPPFSRIYIAYDTALTDDTGSDFNAWAGWGEANGKAFLIRAGQIRAEQPEALKSMAMFYKELKNRYPTVPITPLVRKAVHIDRVAAQYLRTWGVPVQTVRMPRGDLLALARVVSTYVEAAQVYVPRDEGQEWLRKWKQQHTRYPAMAHDDFVATTVYALWRMFRYRQTFGPKKALFLYDDY